MFGVLEIRVFLDSCFSKCYLTTYAKSTSHRNCLTLVSDKSVFNEQEGTVFYSFCNYLPSRPTKNETSFPGLEGGRIMLRK